MARVAEHAARVFGGNYLRKGFGFGRILFMAAAAEVGDVRKFGLVRGRIVGRGVQVLRTVACLAGDVGVFAGGPRFPLIVVAHQAGILTCEGNRLLPDHLERRRPVMAVLSEIFGNNGGTNNQKQAEPGQQHQGGADQMARVPKQAFPFRAGYKQYEVQKALY
jgi:hypothetical protein